MKSFFLRIYPRDISPEASSSGHEVVGVLESVEDEKQASFTSPQELWEILAEKYPESLTINRNKKGKYLR